MAYVRLTPEEKQARREARQEARDKEQFFDDLFWYIEESTEELVSFEAEDARYTQEEVMMMVKLAYEAGKSAS